MKLKPAIKERWTAALRSGRYPQGRLNLRNADDTWCCYGVLCDLAIEDGISSPWTAVSSGSLVVAYVTDHSVKLPSYEVFTWALEEDDFAEALPSRGIPVNLSPEEVESTRLDYRRGYSFDLATLNDAGISFDRIATLIDEQL